MAASKSVKHSKKSPSPRSPITKREVKTSTQKAIAKYGKILHALAHR